MRPPTHVVTAWGNSGKPPTRAGAARGTGAEATSTALPETSSARPSFTTLAHCLARVKLDTPVKKGALPFQELERPCVGDSGEALAKVRRWLSAL
jgi:hypothetical protein